MAEHSIKNSIFEITDYTTASNWERFTALLEETITSWNINKDNLDDDIELGDGDLSSGTWHEKKDILRYGESAFDIRFLFLNLENKTSEIAINKTDNLRDEIQEVDESKNLDKSRDQVEVLPVCLRDIYSSKNDFASKVPSLVRWYGLRHLILLSPNGDTIISENRVKLILSSACMALSNIDCPIPFFVQVHNPRNFFYQGIFEHSNIRTMFEMVFHKRGRQYNNLSDIIPIFREKISSNLENPIAVSIRYNYEINSLEAFQSTPEDYTEYQNKLKVLFELNNGSPAISKNNIFYSANSLFQEVLSGCINCLSPPPQSLSSIQLGVTWHPRSDKIIIDSKIHSDINPLEAPLWTLRVQSRQSGALTIVYQTLKLSKLFDDVLEHAIKFLDGSNLLSSDIDSLRKDFVKISYQLAVGSEIVISREPGCDTRKIVATVYHLAKIYIDQKELSESHDDGIDHIVNSLKRPENVSLNEVYRKFSAENQPCIKEYILKTKVRRPFPQVPDIALPQRMFCTIAEEEFRICGAFSEFCN